MGRETSTVPALPARTRVWWSASGWYRLALSTPTCRASGLPWRAGFAALLYWSPTMRDARLDPADIGDIALAYRWLITQPFIDPDRSGLLGTCVGGSFALMAAAQAEIRDDVAFVVAWAPYASMRTLARDVASATTSTTGGSTQPWLVDPLTRRVYVRTLTALLEPSEAERLRSAACEGHERAAAISLSADGHAVWPLLTSLDA